MLITLPDLTLTTVAPDGTINRKPLSGLEEESVVPEISFASPTSGWLRMSDGQLLSTTDGGETLILLEPGSAPRALPKLTPKLPRVTWAGNYSSDRSWTANCPVKEEDGYAGFNRIAGDPNKVVLTRTRADCERHYKAWSEGRYVDRLALGPSQTQFVLAVFSNWNSGTTVL